ncbi:hypothetical protein ACEWY4_027447 [Coilia grayii]|uniref:Endonuclease/exonuclease/phosphatase domain-containing protein n=1 Tax=Coilia grayii TaxID=363190 RepID=A0ABD1IQ60_9TELE
MSLKNYTLFNVYGPSILRPSGGVAFLIRNDILHSHVVVSSSLQVVAVRLTLHKVLTLCCVYIPPDMTVTLQELDKLAEQLPPPYILLGDFNAYNPIWGGNFSDAKGKALEDFIAKNDLWNDGSPTYLHPGHGTYSAIDLSICDPNLLTDFFWHVNDDLCWSDHFPVIISSAEPDVHLKPPRWQLKKANRTLFYDFCAVKPGQMPQDIVHPVDNFSKILIEIADETIPKTSGKPFRKSNPWFTDDCKNAIAARKKAERLFSKHPTSVNLTALKICRARARRTIKEAKTQSWRKFVANLTSNVSSKKVWSLIKKMKSKGGEAQVQHLKCGDSVFSTKHEIANKLAETKVS